MNLQPSDLNFEALTNKVYTTYAILNVSFNILCENKQKHNFIVWRFVRLSNLARRDRHVTRESAPFLVEEMRQRQIQGVNRPK